MNKYKLTISSKQANTIIEALDFYSRMHCGQADEILRLFRERIHSNEINMSVLAAACNVVKTTTFPELHPDASYGIVSPETPEKAKIAYDVLQVIRNAIAWTENPEGGIQVSYDDPLQTSKEDLSKMEAVDEP